MATILYVRVSTIDQTADHQRTQAEQAGFAVDDVVTDHGVSGVNTKLFDRAGGARLLDKLRRGDTLVVRWIDRLGRNYEDVVASVQQFMKMGVIVRTVINCMTFDGATADPMQKAVRDALLGFMAAMGQAQAEATKAAQVAGIAHAKATGERSYLGRKPSFTRDQYQTASEMLAREEGVSEISRMTGLTRQTIYRIKADPVGQVAALVAWEEKAAA
jgi:DNA invertase Pin-like site-specific DNA recombinase